MTRLRHRSNAFFKFACGIGQRRRPLFVLAAFFVILAILVPRTAAQKSGDSPDDDPYRKRVAVPRTRPSPPVEGSSAEDPPRIFRQITLELEQACSGDSLYALLDELSAAGQLKQAPLQLGNQLRIIIEEEQLHRFSAVQCVQEIMPGRQPRPPLRQNSATPGKTDGSALPQTAAAEDTGSISGTVTADSGGAQLAGITVCAYFQDDTEWQSIVCSDSDVSGQYQLDLLAAGDYRVGFFDSQGSYVSEYYDDMMDIYSAGDVVVSAGSTTSGINAALAAAGFIAGTVTAETSGLPLSGIQVCSEFDNGSYWQTMGCEDSGGDGSYEIRGLPSGSHRVWFSDSGGDFAWEYYDDVVEEYDAAEILVAAGSTTSGINAALAERGHITGTVTAETGGALLPDVYVCAYNAWQIVITCAYTDALGQYDLGYIPGGIHHVEYQEYSGEYLGEFYNDVVDFDSAADILVTPGSTISGIDAALADAGHIAGTVTAESGGAPLQDIDICAYAYTGAYWQGAGCSYTDANGEYDINGLAGGVYRLEFYDLLGGLYLSEYYDNAPDIDSASDINVTAGSTTSGIDAALAEPGHITGTVTAQAGGAVLPAIEACAYVFDDADWQDAACSYTDGSGGYDLADLPPGAYRVGFRDPSGFFAWEYYEDVLLIESATGVIVSGGSTTSGIDAALVVAGHITGTVTAEDGGSTLENIAACAHIDTGSGWRWIGCAYSAANGSYNIGGLATGTYRVEFYDWLNGIYLGEFYNNALDLGSGTNVAVSAGATTPGIQAALAEYGHITGAVTAEFGGDPLSDIETCAYFDNGSEWQLLNCVDTDTNGDYDIGGLHSDTYRLEFTDYGGFYHSEYYDNALDIDSANDIAVSAGSTTSGINAALREYGLITGTVTAASGGAPLAGIQVCTYDSDGSYWYIGRCADSDANGDYGIGGLTAGVYRVGFFDSSGSYVIAYYQDAPNINAATDVLVSDYGTTAGINAALSVLVPAPPANDDFDAAVVVQPLPYQNIADVRYATGAADDPILPCGPGDAGHGSVWNAITPDHYSLLRANTYGSNYDTVLAVWQGVRGSLGAVDCNDDTFGLQSQLSGTLLSGGVTYYIEVAGNDSDLGELVLNIDLEPYTLTQNIPLAAGWNMISSYIEPQVPALETLLAAIEGDMVLLKNGVGGVYWPALPLNSIGDWDVRDGYQIFMNDPATLTIPGPIVNLEQTPIDLPAGWNLIAYLPDAPYPAGQALEGISSQLVMVKNGIGEVYWPAYGVDQIGDMQPGEGYQVYVNSAAVLTYTIPPPTAAFSADVVSGLAPLQVQFTDQSIGSPFLSWAWDFGDGGSSMEQNPSHIYDAPGVYTVSLTVTNSSGSDTETKSGYISVQAPDQWAYIATADTHVRSNEPDSNFGSTNNLRIKDAAADFNAFLKFDIQGLSGSIQSATLRLYVLDASPDGGTVYVVNDTGWSESLITWNNAPPMNQSVTNVGPAVLGQWMEVDVTSAVSGSGLVSFGITSASDDIVKYSSREGSNAPQLYIVQQ